MFYVEKNTLTEVKKNTILQLVNAEKNMGEREKFLPPEAEGFAAPQAEKAGGKGKKYDYIPSNAGDIPAEPESLPSEVLSVYRAMGRQKESSHVPVQLTNEEKYGSGQVKDERGFLLSDPSSDDPEYFEREYAKHYHAIAYQGEKKVNPAGIDWMLNKSDPGHAEERTVSGLIQSLGRVPTPAEVRREQWRAQMLEQVETDMTIGLAAYEKAELIPQREVIEKRKEDFPAPENALEAFANGEVEIQTEGGVTRLIIKVPNKEGRMVEHPVMTDEELEWVERSAEMIARSTKDKNAKVFIAGLGLGLLNEALAKRGIKNQVVAELNHNVIKLISDRLQERNPDLKLDVRQGVSSDVWQKAAKAGEKFETASSAHSTEQVMESGYSNLELRQGDFKTLLQQAVDRGEQFDAISIDAFPNTADEVNRDASNEDVLQLAWKALKPGGILTFYPDSRYLPGRILKVLYEMGVPQSSINYTMAKFKTSDFTQEYHYGELMSVPCIQKPLLAKETDSDQIIEMLNQYSESRDRVLEEYLAKHFSGGEEDILSSDRGGIKRKEKPPAAEAA